VNRLAEVIVPLVENYLQEEVEERLRRKRRYKKAKRYNALKKKMRKL
jgi:hypothetical protein